MAEEYYGDLQFTDNLKGTYSIMWSLHEFSKFSANVGSRRMSQTFSLRHNGSTACRMVIHPEGIDVNTSGFICCALICDKGDTSLTSSFDLLDLMGEKIPFDEGCYKAEDNKSNFCGRMIRRADMMKHIPNDSLVVVVHGGYSKVPVVSVEGQKIPIRYKRPPSEYARLYLSKQGADAVIVVDGEELPVHSLVLSARSEVFWDTFSQHSTEKHPRLEIVDFTRDTVKQFLMYLYCGTAEIGNVDTASELVRAGHAYCREDLKEGCAKYLCDNINDQNVVRLIILADANDTAELRSEALDYFANCRKDIDLKKHEADLVERPKLVFDMLCKIKHAWISINLLHNYPKTIWN